MTTAGTVLADQLASDFVAAYRNGTFVPAPTHTIVGFTREDALAVAERVRALRIAAGAVPVGYKVGFTNGAVREQFGAAGPMAAPVYAETLAAEPRVDASTLLGPRIEPEIVVGIGAHGAIVWAALGFEIVQSHVRDWEFGYLDSIVDFGLHAKLIVGERRAVDATDLAWLLGPDVALSRNGEVVERGAASHVDGGAVGSLHFLREELGRVGRDLLAGELVTTGSMTRVPKIASGERWTLETLGGELPALTIDVD